VVAVVLVHGDRRNLLILVTVCEGFRVRVLAFPSQRAPIINVSLNFQLRNFRVLQGKASVTVHRLCHVTSVGLWE
jgi:hypothetical protein